MKKIFETLTHPTVIMIAAILTIIIGEIKLYQKDKTIEKLQNQFEEAIDLARKYHQKYTDCKEKSGVYDNKLYYDSSTQINFFRVKGDKFDE